MKAFFDIIFQAVFLGAFFGSVLGFFMTLTAKQLWKFIKYLLKKVKES